MGVAVDESEASSLTGMDTVRYAALEEEIFASKTV